MFKVVLGAFGCIFAGVLCMHSVSYAESQIPSSVGQVKLSYAPVVRETSKTIVNVYASKVVHSGGVSEDPLFSFFFGEGYSGMPRERIERSLGSGVIVDPNGLVVTNNHVIRGSDEITVVLNDRREYRADVKFSDPKRDIAVLQLREKNGAFPYAKFGNSAKLEVGDLVLAQGNPFGLGLTTTSGIVSAVERQALDKVFIQTDASINRGNSGGGLFDIQGNLIGISTAIYSQSGGSHGVGFAIPIDLVNIVMDAVKRGKEPTWAWSGLKGQTVTAELAKALGLKTVGGVLINSVTQGGSAQKSGLKPEDVVLSIDGVPVYEEAILEARVERKPVGSKLMVEINRRGERLLLPMTLEAPKLTTPVQKRVLESGYHPLTGAEIGNISPYTAHMLNIEHEGKGVVVLSVAEGSRAYRLGLRRGDIILTVNDEEPAKMHGGTPVENISKLLARDVRVWQISYQRGRQVHRFVVRM